MEEIKQLIKHAIENGKKIDCFQFIKLNLNGIEMDNLLKQLEQNKIHIEATSIYKLIKSKEKELKKNDNNIFESAEQYFKEINQLDILNACEEKILFYFYRENKTDEVRNYIASFYLKLVSSIAMEYVQKIKNTSYQFLDIIQDGNIGLIKAVEKYDVMIGARFSIYATWWIKRYIDVGLMEKSKSIRVPLKILEDYNKIIKIITMYKNEGKKHPTNSKIASELEITENRVNYVLNIMSKTVVSLDEYVGDLKKNTKFAMIPSDELSLEELVIENDEYELIKRIMRGVLTEKEFFVVSCKNGFINESNKIPGEKTLDEVGKILGLTRERIRQILKPAYEKIKNAYENDIVKEKIIKNNKK